MTTPRYRSDQPDNEGQPDATQYPCAGHVVGERCTTAHAATYANPLDSCFVEVRTSTTTMRSSVLTTDGVLFAERGAVVDAFVLVSREFPEHRNSETEFTEVPVDDVPAVLDGVREAYGHTLAMRARMLAGQVGVDTPESRKGTPGPWVCAFAECEQDGHRNGTTGDDQDGECRVDGPVEQVRTSTVAFDVTGRRWAERGLLYPDGGEVQVDHAEFVNPVVMPTAVARRFAMALLRAADNADGVSSESPQVLRVMREAS